MPSILVAIICRLVSEPWFLGYVPWSDTLCCFHNHQPSHPSPHVHRLHSPGSLQHSQGGIYWCNNWTIKNNWWSKMFLFQFILSRGREESDSEDDELHGDVRRISVWSRCQCPHLIFSVGWWLLSFLWGEACHLNNITLWIPCWWICYKQWL